MVVYNSRTEKDGWLNRSRQLRKNRTDIYNTWEKLVTEIVHIASLKQFDRRFDKTTQKSTLTFSKNGGLSFRHNPVPSILGVKGTHNGFVHIGYKTNIGNRNASKRHLGNFPVDTTCVSQLICD